ncbi:MAG: UDP-N-acetylglucosamine--N-acetylmuramyl-(pentapeptide) pyrophosphoryl-undecaprenol N-acetylglucosamine transferase [Phycisphaerales bacterium]|nr:UDP-N-acetylglucosamine--N-acetylmuramyl-(pentapeptide) pyrophosphoryl-undecaprenol N-acetylglucosamine transferase [Phycisphaerales bacterium]
MSAGDAPGILLAGGGTGGHIFPLLAVAESAREVEPKVQCRFVCSARPLDAEILTREGEAFDAIPARPFGVRPRSLARFAMGWGASVRAARDVLRAHRPGVIITSGGFVSAPIVQAARTEPVPVIAVNLDAVAGRANRWVARHAAVRLSATDALTDRVPPRWQRIGPIVRKPLRTPADPATARQAFGLDPHLPTLLVTGGSQGAQTVNGAIAWMLANHAQAFVGWQALHQCGGSEAEATELRAAYERAGMRARVMRFIEDMASAWFAAELGISRAGAGAVAEVWATATPSIFLPYPFHRDQHQRINAAACERTGGAIIVQDLIEPERAGPAIAQELVRLLSSGAARSEMIAALRSMGPCDGAETVARAALARIANP